MDLKDLLSRASDHLSVARAFGTAYEREGALIIPVAMVAGGGGGGGTHDSMSRAATRFDGDVDDVDDDDVDDHDEFIASGADARGTAVGGSGGGFGGMVMPLGVYVVKNDRVRWMPAINGTAVLVAAIGLIGVLARASKGRHRH
ncbi:MAG: spore germination protein GerW family protein [Acidimicrobiales bacterium]